VYRSANERFSEIPVLVKTMRNVTLLKFSIHGFGYVFVLGSQTSKSHPDASFSFSFLELSWFERRRISNGSNSGCVECLASPRGWWFHLRRCAECGHIGCCDNSPSQHASKHAAATGHPVITSFEPGEDWFFDYDKQEMIKGVELLPPHSHQENQPTPGPAGRVPANWESLLN
jgi:hypothetical protein